MARVAARKSTGGRRAHNPAVAARKSTGVGLAHPRELRETELVRELSSALTALEQSPAKRAESLGASPFKYWLSLTPMAGRFDDRLFRVKLRRFFAEVG